MNPQETRQARRLIRNAQAVERQLFDFVQELQDADADDSLHFSWDAARDRIRLMQEGLRVLLDLVNNIRQEVS